MSEIWNIKIQVLDSYKKCEVKSTMTLEELCPFILKIFKFDNDHLHEFYMGKRTSGPYSDNIMKFKTHQEGEITLDDLFPNDEQLNLFLHFDFGDSWIFRVMKYKKDATYNSRAKYPRVVSSVGGNPVQYPEYEDDVY